MGDYKELSIKEKAQRYDEILARAKGTNFPYYKEDVMGKVKEFVDYLLPELKEKKSEDEKIRERVVYAINQLHVCECTKNKLLAWIENQCKQKYWSKKDEKIMIAIFLFIESYGACGSYEVTQEEMLSWLESLKDRVGCATNCATSWKPSDEQIMWLYRAADDASKDSRMKQVLNDLLSDLKKLKNYR